MTINEQMDISVENAIRTLQNAHGINQDPANKLYLVKQVLRDLESFDEYWSDTFEEDQA